MILSEIEHQKLLFLKEVRKTLASDTCFLDFKILNIKIQLRLPRACTMPFDFLKDYFAAYLIKDNLGSIDVTIDYHPLNDDRSQLSHPWWSERLPKIHFLPSDEGFTYLIERDLIGLIDSTQSKFQVWGPDIGPSNTDSIDNLMTRVISFYIRKTQTFILHASCILKDHRAYVFFGESGAGKSTLAEYCLNELKMPIIASDQCYLSWYDGQVFAQTTPITVPELRRDDPMRIWQAVPVQALILLDRNQPIGLTPLKSTEVLHKLLEQSLPYLAPDQCPQALLSILAKILSCNQLQTGALHYNKGSNFWGFLDF